MLHLKFMPGHICFATGMSTGLGY